MIDSNSIQLVTFQLGSERYGIDIINIKEIHGRDIVRPLPNAPTYIEGLFNLRGSVIPIVSLHRQFGIEEMAKNDRDELLSGFIILKIGNITTGIIIDKILRVVNYPRNIIQAPPQIISGISGEYIQGVVNEDDTYMIILDIVHLFTREELVTIATQLDINADETLGDNAK